MSDDQNQDEKPTMLQMDPKDEIRMLKQRCDLMGIPYGPNSGVELLRSKVNAKLAEGEQTAPPAPAPEPEVAEVAEVEAAPSSAIDPTPEALVVAQAEETTAMENVLNAEPSPTAPPEQVSEVEALKAQVQMLMNQMNQMAENSRPAANPYREEPAYGPGGRVPSQRIKGGGTFIPEEIRRECVADAMKLVRIRLTNMNPNKKGLHGEVICVGNSAIGMVKKFIPFDPAFTENGYHVPNVIYQELKSKQFVNIRTTRDRRTGTEVVSDSMAREFAIEVLPPLTPEELADLARQQTAAGAIDTETQLQ